MVRQTSFRSMTPAGLVIDGISVEADRILVCAHPCTTSATCPECGVGSTRIHSRYTRRLADLPAQGHIVRLNVQVRRFRCGNAECRRRIFGEALAARRSEIPLFFVRAEFWWPVALVVQVKWTRSDFDS